MRITRSAMRVGWRATIAVSIVCTLSCGNRTQAKLADLEQRIRDAGQPVTLEELDRYYPEVPDSSNAARMYQEAYPYFLQIDSDASRTIRMFNSLKDSSGAIPSSLSEEIARHVSACNAVFDRFDRATSYPSSRHAIDLTKGLGAKLPHILPLSDCGKLEVLRGALALRDSRFDEFVSSQRSILSMARSLRNEPVFHSQLIRMELHAYAVDALQHGLERHAFPYPVLSELSSLYDHAEDTEPFVRCFAGERCAMADVVYRLRRGEVDAEWSPLLKPSVDFYVSCRFPTGSEREALRERLVVLEQLTPFASAADLAWPERMKLATTLKAFASEQPTATPAACIMLAPMESGAVSFGRETALFRLVRTALAVEKFRVHNGAPPDEIGQLVPRYLSAPISDPFDGEPLRYKRLGGGYMVFSVYQDLSNDGGVQAEKNDSGEWLGDWVFEVRR